MKIICQGTVPNVFLSYGNKFKEDKETLLSFNISFWDNSYGGTSNHDSSVL